MIEQLRAAKDAIMLIAILLLAVLLGWNYWRKNVYYDALHITAAAKVQEARTAEQAQRDALNKQEARLNANNKAVTDDLQKQLAEIANRPPTERIVWKLRDRFQPVSCSATTGAGDNITVQRGLSADDEQFLVRFAAACNVERNHRNAAVDAIDKLAPPTP